MITPRLLRRSYRRTLQWRFLLLWIGVVAIPAIAALISAVENALEPFGVTIAEAPITPQRIVELLGEAARAGTRR